MKKITEVEVLSAHLLKITFADGRAVELDFKDKIKPGTVTAPLLNFECFKQVKVTQAGRAIEWPGEIDFCADSLWLESEQSLAGEGV